MKKIVMFGLFLIPTLAMSATPDFSGTWARDSASDPVPNLMYWMTRVAPAPPRAGGGQRAPQVVLTIHQDGKTLSAAESQNILRKFVLDGQPHVRSTDTGLQKAEVTAQMQADSLVIQTKEPFGGMPGNVTVNVKEVWTLSPDGKTLTIVTTRDIPARHQEYKEVYTKTQDQSGAICSAGCVTP